MKRKFLITFLFAFVAHVITAQTPAQMADSLKKGFRGLAVVNENVIWMSGRKGLVGITNDGAKTWSWNRVKGFENSDFRSIHAFDKRTAVVATAGFPAAILRTSNGGKTWNKVFSSKDSAMFFDGIAFWDAKHGIIFGDPVNGRMYLSETKDAGKTWQEIPFAQRPQLQNGEASFAASGTTICTLPGGHVWIVTGGTASRLWHSRDYGQHWEAVNTPLVQGKPSQGIFSMVFYDTLHAILVGGDYADDVSISDNCFMTINGGKSWIAPQTPPSGYRSCVAVISPNQFIATGTSGTDISNDGGITWKKLPAPRAANTLNYFAKGNRIYFCGSPDKLLETYIPEKP